MGEASRRKASGDYPKKRPQHSYEFLVFEWIDTPQGQPLVDIRHHCLRDHEAAADMAESIAEEFYQVDERGNRSGTPVVVIMRCDDQVIGMTLPLAKAVRRREVA